MSRLDEFREFVKKYPLLKDEVQSKNRSWQDIYEEWVLYGESDSWEKYKIVDNANNQNSNSVIGGFEGIKNVFSNIKKIDPNKVNNTLNSVQKVLQIAQTVTGSKVTPTITNSFSDWWE